MGRWVWGGPRVWVQALPQALRGRVDSRSYIPAAKHWVGIPYNLEGMVLCWLMKTQAQRG